MVDRKLFVFLPGLHLASQSILLKHHLWWLVTEGGSLSNFKFKMNSMTMRSVSAGSGKRSLAGMFSGAPVIYCHLTSKDFYRCSRD